MQRQAKKRSGDAGGAGGTKRAVTPRSAFIVLACTAIAEYFAFYLRLADAGAKAGIPHGGYVMCALICGVASLATTAGFGLLLFAERNRITKNLKQLLITVILLLVSTVLSAFTTCVWICFYSGIPRDYSCRTACRKTLCVRMHSHAGSICSSVCLFARCCSCI